MTQKIISAEVSRWIRIFLANRAIALGWALKGSCKQCAHRLFTTARLLVPEAQRFLVHHTGSQNRNFEFAVDLTRLSRIPPLGVVAGLVVVLVLLGLLDLAMRANATGTQVLEENSASQHELRTPSESQVISVSKSSEAMQGFVLETGSISPAEIAPVPLPLRKPTRVYKAPNGKGAKANPATQKRRVAQQKRSKGP